MSNKTMPELREIVAQYVAGEDAVRVVESCLDCAYMLGAFEQAAAVAERLRADRSDTERAAS